MFDRKEVRLDPRLPWLKNMRRVLSPMSGITDRPFRDICRRFGVDMAFCEFASASGLKYGGDATWKLIDSAGEKDLIGIQIFGADPEHMAEAARLFSGHRLDVLDLNFGCPAKKVVRNSGGSALMADVDLLEKIVKEVIAASDVPVTAKIRTGWDEDSVNYKEVGLVLQEAGVSWVTIHGRTRAQQYRGQADWDRIADLVETLDIPVIGNGDVTDGESYKKMVEHTRCFAVMVGRASIGNPWGFAEMKAVDEGRTVEKPAFSELCKVAAEHIRSEVAFRGEGYGCLVVRKHIAKCFRGYPGASDLRKRLFSTEESDTMLAILDEVANQPDPRSGL